MGSDAFQVTTCFGRPIWGSPVLHVRMKELLVNHLYQTTVGPPSIGACTCRGLGRKKGKTFFKSPLAQIFFIQGGSAEGRWRTSYPLAWSPEVCSASAKPGSQTLGWDRADHVRRVIPRAGGRSSAGCRMRLAPGATEADTLIRITAGVKVKVLFQDVALPTVSAA
jgi:hypothetical protein